MKIKKFLIAGGNPTVLISDHNEKDTEKLTKKYLKEAEQVGF